MYGMYGTPIISDPVVGEYWVEKSDNKKYLLDKKDTNGSGMVLYHLADEDTGYERGWWLKDDVLKYFSKWADPWAEVKDRAKKDGWVWRESI